MTEDRDEFQEYSDARFGFKVRMPKRFEILPTTVDPLARLIRGLDDLSEDEQRKRQQQLPVGFWDPELIGSLEGGQYQPLRLIEYDALRGGDEPVTPERAGRLWDEVAEFMPKTLESAGMPGYRYLGTGETRLGALRALTFDYRWDGPRPKMYGGDHVRIVWALGDSTTYHAYYHCSTQEWDERLPEFERILASFAELEPEEMEAEAAGSRAAKAAFNAAKAAGEPDGAAVAAGRAAYEAAMAGAAAADAAAADAADADAATDAADPDAAPGADAAADAAGPGAAAADEK